MFYEPSPLPYDLNALSPILSKETLEYHYGKHHLGYFKKLNKLIADNDLETNNSSLTELIRHSVGALFNNAAQCWNHDFYWKSLTVLDEEKVVSQRLTRLIDQSFGGWNEFKLQFLEAGNQFFGSGWLWLIHNGDQLELMTTANAQTPITDPQIFPLLTCDLWEHAYYIDYHNDRAKYLEQIFNILNWRFADQCLGLCV